MFFGIERKKSHGWTWTVATRVIYIPFVLTFMTNLKKGDSYWVHVNNPIPENMKYNTQL